MQLWLFSGINPNCTQVSSQKLHLGYCGESYFSFFFLFSVSSSLFFGAFIHY